MSLDINKWYVQLPIGRLKRYNHDRYWRRRAEVVNPQSKKPKWLRALYLYLIKRSDAFNNASMGTGWGSGAQFDTPPILPHGLNGIIVSHNAHVGARCVLFQRVTIAWGGGGDATIGNDVSIGSGACIIGGCTIGDNVKIGANAVVVTDVPSNCTVVGVPAKIVNKKSETR